MENAIKQQQPNTSFSRREIQQEVTDTIIRQLEAGTVPWFKPWKSDGSSAFGLPYNAATGKKYRGSNILLLWNAATGNQYTTHEWASFRQWQEKNEFIRKGEKGSPIVYYDTFEKEVDGENQNIPFLKTSVVFNRCQLASYQPTKVVPKETWQLLDDLYALDDFIAGSGADICHMGSEAYYDIHNDTIYMPEYDRFIATEKCPAPDAYFSILLHELSHWTAAKHRLNRPLISQVTDPKYAQEELTAELGAAFLCAEFGIAAPQAHQASYIAHWLKVLQDNKQYLFTAASEASKIVDYLRGLQPEA